MANLNDLDLKICASESDVPTGTPEKDQLILVRGEGGGGGGIEEAPMDGKAYGRKDGEWVEVAEPVNVPVTGVDLLFDEWYAQR